MPAPFGSRYTAGVLAAAALLAACGAGASAGDRVAGSAEHATTSVAAPDSPAAHWADAQQSVASAALSARRAAPALLTAADRTSFAKLAAPLAEAEGVAVSWVGLGQTVYRAGSFKTGVAWSSSKPAVAVATLAAATGTDRDRTRAITASDNDAAQRLWTSLGPTAAAKTTAQVRAAGDPTTVIESTRLRGPAYSAFGQTQWSLANQARFAAGIACTDAGRRVEQLMRHVVPGQRWGLGTIGTNPAFKGGWGPGVQPGVASGWLDRQMGVVTIGGRPVAVAIATTAGDHGTGTSNLTKIASWLKTHVDTSGAPESPRC